MNSVSAFINASRECFFIIFESILLACTLNILVICLIRIVFKILVGKCTTKSLHIALNANFKCNLKCKKK